MRRGREGAEEAKKNFRAGRLPAIHWPKAQKDCVVFHSGENEIAQEGQDHRRHPSGV